MDDASPNDDVREVLKRWKHKDKRIKVFFAQENGGIAASINQCATSARGNYFGVLDHDDMLAPVALEEYARLIEQHPQADLIYCDEDKIDLEGNLCEPWYKPDWNPDLALSFNFVMHFVMICKKLFQKLGGVRSLYEGSQDYDLLLRASEKTNNIFHISKILYHWRMGPGSIAGGPDPKPDVFAKGLAALNAALHRRGIQGDAQDAPDAWKGVYRVCRKLTLNLKCSCLIIQHSPDQEPLDRLLTSIYAYAPQVEIIILPTDTNIAATFNAGAQSAKGDILFFLDDTMQLLEGSYLSLLEQIQRQEVGVVGGKVFYENNLIEHAGVILGPFNLLGYANRATPDVLGYAGLNRMICNYSAVMGLGCMTSKSLFEQAGGFDPALATAYWDVDYCLKLRQMGYLITFTPYAVLKHYIEMPLGINIKDAEAGLFQERWQDIIDRDPYFNPHFSRELENFSCSE